MAKKESGANYFASMTDMMVGILFIFIIMIAYFAFQVVNKDKQSPLLVYIDRGEKLRQGLAEKVADDLRHYIQKSFADDPRVLKVALQMLIKDINKKSDE